MTKRNTYPAAPAALILGAAAFLLPDSRMWAHHGSEAAGAAPVINAGGVVSGNPRSFLTVQEDWLKGSRPEIPEPVPLANGNVTPQAPPQNIMITTVFAEHAFSEGISANLLVPIVRYDRKGAPDYSRIGNVFLGLRAAPFVLIQHLGSGDALLDRAERPADKGKEESNIFLTVDGRLGFPSGSDQQVATRTDFWQGAAGITGGISVGRFRLIGRAEGQWPLSKLERTEEPSSFEKYAALLNGRILDDQSSSNFELKKVTIFSGYLYFFPVKNFGVYGGMLYQDPFPGVVFDKRREVPRIYREAQAGATFRIGENAMIIVAYRYPLERGDDRKKIDEAYTASFTLFL